MTDLSNTSARARRAAVLAAAAMTLSVLPGSSAHAIDRMGIGTQHFVDCLGLLLSDPAAHEANCLPNRVVPQFGTLSSSETSRPVVVPPVVVPPDEEDDCYNGVGEGCET